MKQVQKYKKPVFITESMLKNGWVLNGYSFYFINGDTLTLHLSIRHGNIGIKGTELLTMPYKCLQSWSPNMYKGNGDIILNENGVVSILTEVTNSKTANINVDIITMLK